MSENVLCEPIAFVNIVTFIASPTTNCPNTSFLDPPLSTGRLGTKKSPKTLSTKDAKGSSV